MSAPRVRLPFAGTFRMTQGFAERPEVYKRYGLLGHNGIDWGMKVGTPILAVADGKVVEAKFKDDPKGWDADGYGNYLKLEHTWGESLYAHLSRIDVAEGDTVREGDRIGLSGNTGFSSGPHLHFGMRVKPFNRQDGWSGYTNPAWFLVGPGFNEAVDGARLAELTQRAETAEKALAEAQAAFNFQRQELIAQAELYREHLLQLLQRYVPGQLPPNADLLAILETLLQREGAQFRQQELVAQVTLWREKVTELVRRYLPGQLPPHADPLVALEALLQQWSEDLKRARLSQLAAFAPPPSAPLYS